MDIHKNLFVPYPKLEELYLKTIKPESIKIRDDKQYYQEKMIANIKRTNSAYILLMAIEYYSNDLDYFKHLLSNFKGDLKQDIVIGENRNTGLKEITNLLTRSFEKENMKIFMYLMDKKGLNKIIGGQEKFNAEIIHKAHSGQFDFIYHCIKADVTLYDFDIHMEDDMLLTAAARNNEMKLVKYLVDNDADVHARGDHALRSAASSGNLAIVKYLLDNDADIHAWGDECIRTAAAKEDIKIIHLLVDNGADIFNRPEKFSNNFSCAFDIAINKANILMIKYFCEKRPEIFTDKRKDVFDRSIKLLKENSHYNKVSGEEDYKNRYDKIIDYLESKKTDYNNVNHVKNFIDNMKV